MPTFTDLLRTGRRHTQAPFRNSRNVAIETVRVTRSVGTRTILFTGTSYDPNTETGGCAIQMQFVVPKEAAIDERTMKEYKPSLSKDRILVRSSCPWYKFAYGYNNAREKAHFGRVSQFQVQGTGRPVNPRNFAGLDKHLIALGRALQDEGLVRG